MNKGHTQKMNSGKTPSEGDRRRRSRRGIDTILLVIYDLIAVNASYFLALWLRFDCRYSMIPDIYLENWLHFVPVYSIICLAVFVLLKLYKSIWRYASYTELYRVINATIVTSILHFASITLFYHRMPVSYHIIGAIFQFILIVGVRFSYRFVFLILTHNSKRHAVKLSRVMMIGAGSAARLILRDILHSESIMEDEVCCIIDDDPSKWGKSIEGIPIVGGREEILPSAEKYKIEKIYLAIPSASAEVKRDLLSICSETDCELKQLPGIYQFVTGQLTASSLKKVSIEDLLGRDPIQPDLTEVFEFIRDKVIIVTGGGGSIGSELCRQIASHSPKQLIILDIYENNAYDIQLELKDRYPDLDSLCEDLDVSRDALTRTLDGIGYAYSPAHNQFVRK